jgi:hypothetical protein
MSRKLFGTALTLLALAALAKPAQASVWPHTGTSYYYAGYYSYYPAYYSYYYPAYYYVPTVRYYAPVEIRPITPCPAALTSVPVTSGIPPYAQPFPAPPSQNKEPPLDKKGLPPPKVSESRSFSPSPSEDKSIMVSGPAKGACRVGFWNITGRDVTLTIDGKAVQVPANRNVTLTLGREFSWHVEGQPNQQERVPDDKAAHEIVLR